MTDTPRLDAFRSAQRLTGDYELSDLSPQAISRLSMADYAKIRERAGLDPIDPFATAYAAYEPPSGATTVSAPAQPQPPADAPQGFSLADMTMEQYAAVRGRLGVQGREYGRGIMQGGSTADWIEAAQSRGIGRTSYGQNVQEAARIDAGKYLTRNEPVTGRATWYR